MIIQKDAPIEFENRAKLVVKHQVQKWRENAPFMYLIHEHCMCEFTYRTKKEVPEKNVTCVHGNKMIKYLN